MALPNVLESGANESRVLERYMVLEDFPTYSQVGDLDIRPLFGVVDAGQKPHSIVHWEKMCHPVIRVACKPINWSKVWYLQTTVSMTWDGNPADYLGDHSRSRTVDIRQDL